MYGELYIYTVKTLLIYPIPNILSRIIGKSGKIMSKKCIFKILQNYVSTF